MFTSNKRERENCIYVFEERDDDDDDDANAHYI